MASMKLGSKSDAFHREGQTWVCTTGLQSDVTIEIGEVSFNLHKFPLLSRSGLLEKLIEEESIEEGHRPSCVISLNDIPGGTRSFELVAKFCYGVKIELTALNIVCLRCAAEYLQMTEDFGEGNLISLTESFLNEVFGNWKDSIKALETCEEVMSYAEEVHVVSRCIDSLAMKACADPNVINLLVSGQSNGNDQDSNVDVWNGICTKPDAIGDDWWYEDVSYLNLLLYRRLVLAVQAKGMKPETISGSLMYYAKRYIPLINKQSGFSNGTSTTVSAISETDQRIVLEEIVSLLPPKKGVTPSKFLLSLLCAALMLHASPSCKESLERRIGAQLEQAVLVDLLIPNMGESVDTLYDIDCIQRILDHFILSNQEAALSASPCIVEEGQFINGPDTLTPVTMVAGLMDGFLAEVAPDVNLKLPKFEALAATIPDYARPLDDGLYHAIDVYLKAHPWLSDTEREQLCRLMNCQKLSLEASTHAAQNERLPLRVIVQVLFFEQLRLRTSISGWFFVSENLESSQINPSGNILPPKNISRQLHAAHVNTDNMKQRVSDLEKECLSMKEELQKLIRTKKRWQIFSKKFGFRQKLHPCYSKESCDFKEATTAAPSVNAQQIQENCDMHK